MFPPFIIGVRICISVTSHGTWQGICLVYEYSHYLRSVITDILFSLATPRTSKRLPIPPPDYVNHQVFYAIPIYQLLSILCFAASILYITFSRGSTQLQPLV